MADMIVPQKGGRRKIHNTRIDLTPMVDLGFLLITFFMFTTTLVQSKVMDINMPDNSPTPAPSVVIEESVITLIPVKDHKVYWYEGSFKNEEQLKECPLPGLRNVLLRKQKEVAALPATYSANAHKMYVIIKPDEDCKYADIISLLDEMLIIDCANYSIGDVSHEEKEAISKK